MEKFSIIPMLDPGNIDCLPCEEAEANRWAVQIDPNTYLVYESREDAEKAAQRMLAKYLRTRADRFVWRDGDVEHH